MKIELKFSGNGKASIDLKAETEAERSILAFMAEDCQRRYAPIHQYTYRPSGVENVTLIEVQTNKEN